MIAWAAQLNIAQPWTFASWVDLGTSGGCILAVGNAEDGETPAFVLSIRKITGVWYLIRQVPSASTSTALAGFPGGSGTLVVTATGSALVVRFRGTQVFSGSYTAGTPSSGSVCLGYDGFGSVESEIGFFDTRVYNKVLSADAISTWEGDVTGSKFLYMPTR